MCRRACLRHTMCRQVHRSAAAALGPTLGQLAGTDLLVQGKDRMQQRLGPRRATGCIHVDRNNLVDALHDGVVVEHAAAGRAHTHRQHPLGLHHLVVDLAQHGCHLLADAARNDHQIGLARRCAERLHAEAGQVVVGRARRHHLDGAAGEPEGGRHQAAPTRPLHQFLHRCGEDVVTEPGETVVDAEPRLEVVDACHQPAAVPLLGCCAPLHAAAGICSRPVSPTVRTPWTPLRPAGGSGRTRRLRGPHSSPPIASS